MPTTAAASAPQTPARYRKGDEARQRILDVALKAFGSDGFQGATTRRIAQEAGVNLPALKYYFGGKEGLYLACALEIVGGYRERMLQPIGGAQHALAANATPAQAKAALRTIVGMLAELLVGTRESQVWTAFVQREMADQGPAFTVLYENVWAPGVELVARLIARARGEAGIDEDARIEALLLISSLSAFSIARPVALKYLDWPDAAGERFDRVRAIVEARIDGLG